MSKFSEKLSSYIISSGYNVYGGYYNLLKYIGCI